VRASKRRARSNDALDAEAAELTSAIRGHGYDHVTVKADRGFLYVDADGEPLVRLKPALRRQQVRTQLPSPQREVGPHALHWRLVCSLKVPHPSFSGSCGERGSSRRP
jgi:hypothetical protein